jgi:hypothetical protein
MLENSLFTHNHGWNNTKRSKDSRKLNARNEKSNESAENYAPKLRGEEKETENESLSSGCWFSQIIFYYRAREHEWNRKNAVLRTGGMNSRIEFQNNFRKMIFFFHFHTHKQIYRFLFREMKFIIQQQNKNRSIKGKLRCCKHSKLAVFHMIYMPHRYTANYFTTKRFTCVFLCVC